MCTLAVYFQAFSGYPLVVAANRDEFLDRPSAAPAVLDASFGIFGGRDERFGGTWLGVNSAGTVAALLNRRTVTPPDPHRRSRGLLCLEALRPRSAAEALRRIRNEDPSAYNPFNLLVAGPDGAWVATNHGGVLSTIDLAPGLHLLTNLDLNDPTCPRIAASHRSFAGVAADGDSPADAGFIQRLQQILASHDTALDPRVQDPGNSLCVHAESYGTRSSTIAYLDRDRRWTYFHCDDAPCRGAFRRYPVATDGPTAASAS